MVPVKAKMGRILVFEKTKNQNPLLSELLSSEYELYSESSVTSVPLAFERYDPNVIVIDDQYSDSEVLNLCQIIRSLDIVNNSYTGIILMAKDGDSELIGLAANAGCDSFFMTKFIKAQLPAILKSVYRLRETTDKLRFYTERLLASNIELENLVMTDELTGLYNMRFVRKKLVEEFSLAKSNRTSLCILMIDIDHFKEVNDGADHLLGSFVIGEVGKEIFKVVRRADIPGRYGGDEFVIILPSTTESGAMVVAQRLTDRIMHRVYNNGVDATQITISQGIAVYQGEDDLITCSDDLLRRADHALYEAKDRGRNRVIVFKGKVIPKKSKKQKAS